MRRREIPRRAAGGGGNQREDSPEKNEHGDRNGQFLGRLQTEQRAEPAEKIIEKHVGVLRRKPQTGRLAVPDQLREPRVIEMTAEVGRDDFVMPEAGNQDHCGNDQNSQKVVADESVKLGQSAAVRLETRRLH